MQNTAYNEQQFRQKKQLYRFKLGCYQFYHHPIYNLIWFAVIYLGIQLYRLIGFLCTAFELPRISLMIYTSCLNFAFVFIMIFFSIFLIQSIGESIAKDDEIKVCNAFKKSDLENKYIILAYKRTDKKTSITTRIFYTNIILKYWKKYSDDICGNLTCHLVKDIDYKDSNGNFIVLKSGKGHKPKERGMLYDELM